jgi:iron complex outermembrane receptor protein
MDSTLFLKEIEIEENRIFESASFKVQSIDSTSLTHFRMDNLATLLAAKSPLFIKFYGVSGLATPSFRGTSAGHTQVYWNGVSLNSPTLGQVDFSLFPVGLSDEVNVLYGAASLAEGVGGFGGAIQLNTKINQNSTPKFSFSQAVASFDTFKSALNLEFGNKKVKSSSKLFYKSAKNEFPYTFKNQKYKQSNASLLQYGFLQELYAFISPNQYLAARVWFQKSERQIPPTILVNKNDEKQHDNSLKTMLEWNKKTSQGKFNMTAAYMNDFLEYQNVPAEINSQSRVESFQFNTKFYRTLNPKLLVEYGYRFMYNQANINAYKNKQTQTQNSVFTALEYQITRKITLNTLVRQSLFDGELTPFLPTFGVNYANQGSKKTFEIKANLARNFRNPTLNDLYWFPVGNPDLKPEKGWNAELSLGIGNLKSEKTVRFQTELTYFTAKIEDWILWTPAVAGYWRPENLKTVKTQGIEFNFDVYKDWETWKLHFTNLYTFTQSLNIKALNSLDQTKGKQLIYIPKHSQKSSLRVSKKSFHLLLEEQYFSRRYTTTDNKTYLPYYILLNISAGKSFALRKKYKLLLQLKMQNLANFQYQSISFYPMAGRRWEFGLTLTK